LKNVLLGKCKYVYATYSGNITSNHDNVPECSRVNTRKDVRIMWTSVFGGFVSSYMIITVL